MTLPEISRDTEKLEGKVVRTLASAQILNGVGTAGTVAAGSLLVSSISHSETLAGLAQTTAVLGAAAMAIPLSRLTNFGGRRLALSVGYLTGVVGAIIAILGGTNQKLFLMLIGTFLVGAASAAGYQARFAAVDLASESSRSRKLSIVVWGSTVGAVTGPNLMEPAGNVAENLGLPRLVGPYLLAGVTLTLATCVIVIFLKPDPYLVARGIRSQAQRNHPDIQPKESVGTLKTIRAISRQPRALFAISAIGIGHLVMVAIMVMTPVHMAHVDVTLSIIGLVISVHVAGMYSLSPLIGYVSDRFGRVRTIQLGIFILLAAALIAGRSPGNSAPSLALGLFLLGLGWSCTLIAGSTLLSEVVDQSARTATQGASDLIMNLMGAGGGVMAGIVISVLSYGWLCVFASVPVVLLGIWTLRLK